MANFEKFASENQWSLKNDIELKETLQIYSNYLLETFKDFESSNDDMEKHLCEMEIRLSHIHDRINCVKTERFVEEEVDDIGKLILAQKLIVPEKEKKDIIEEGFEKSTIRAISSAIVKGFNIISNETLSASDPIDPGYSTSSSNIPGADIRAQYHTRQLPPVIGTDEFYASIQTELYRISSGSGPNIAYGKEEDIQSSSSNKSAPPQDPIVVIEKADKQKNSAFAEIFGNISESGPQIGKKEIPEMDTGTSSKQVYQKETVEPEQLSSTIKFDSNLPPTIQQTKPHISSSITHKDNSHESTYRYIEVPNATEQDLATASTSDQKFSSHPKISKNKSKRIGRKSLFSSEESDEEANQLVLNSAQRKRNSHSPQMEKKQQEEKLIEGETIQAPNYIEEMPKPVFKTFDNSFSDRLAAVIQNGPIALRPDRAVTRRPLSAQSINSGDDEAPKPLRKTESSISSNEELGPATVKARIAQIGSKIPAPRAGIIVNEETRAPQIIGKNGTEFEETNAPIPTQQAEAMKTRAKGPMRRAPTQIGPPKAPHKDGGTTTKELPPRGSSEIPQGNAIEREVSKTTAATQFKAPPPAVPPRQKGHSIFSSSSSEDEMTRLKTTKQNARSHQQKQQILTTTKEEKTTTTIGTKHVPPILPKKNEPAKQRKGLFDDTDSDF